MATRATVNVFSESGEASGSVPLRESAAASFAGERWCSARKWEPGKILAANEWHRRNLKRRILWLWLDPRCTRLLSRLRTTFADRNIDNSSCSRRFQRSHPIRCRCWNPQGRQQEQETYVSATRDPASSKTDIPSQSHTPSPVRYIGQRTQQHYIAATNLLYQAGHQTSAESWGTGRGSFPLPWKCGLD